MARKSVTKSTKKKSGCLLPIIIFLVLVGLFGSAGDEDSAKNGIQATTEPTKIVEYTSADTEGAEATAPSTEQPTVTSTPTVRPTAKPTFTPTEKPTATSTPTAKPTATPTPTVKPVAAKEYTYVLNKNTKKFHYASCSSAKQIKDKNRAEFTGTREEVIKKGYDPCGRCHP